MLSWRDQVLLVVGVAMVAVMYYHLYLAAIQKGVL